MDETNPAGTPPAQATPVAAQPATSSSTVQDDFKKKAESVRTAADLRAAIEEMKRQPKQPVAPKPAPEPAAVEDTPAVEPEAQTTETSEVTPEAVEGETEQPEAQATETEDGEDGGDGPITPVTGKRIHLRVNEGDELGRLVDAYRLRNRDWTLAQALEAAQKQMGVTPQTTEQKTPEQPKGPQMPKTVQEAETAIQQKLADYKKAMAEVRFEDAADINAEIMQLTMHRSTIERSAEREQQQAAAKYDADFDASEAKATELYAFVTDPNHPASKRMKEIEATLKATDDPLYYSPNKPLKVAQMVAAEMNIAPKAKTAAPAKPAAVTAPNAPKKGMVPSGSSRTVPAAPKPAIDPSISGIKSVGDFRKVAKQLGIPL